LLPAGAQLAIAAIAPLEVEIVRPEDYFGYVQVILALFCAVVTPELLGRDQRTRTLALYFARALSRADYVTAKLGGLGVSIFAVLFLPQVALYAGSALASQDVVDYLVDDAGRIPPVFASSLLVALYMSSVSLAIAGQTPRRAISTAAILAFFVVFTTIGAILVETTSGDLQQAFVFFSPVAVLDGAIRWLFGVEPPADTGVAEAGVHGAYLLLGALAHCGLALAVLYRRFARLAV
jgi:ABC-2 type transport system permease protein